MRRLLPLSLLPFLAATAFGQGAWMVGAGSGAFVFGDFAEIHTTVQNEQDRLEIVETLSADTRAGAQVHVGRWIDERWSIRADATFVRAPFSVETASNDEDGVVLEVGEMDVTTVALAAAFRFNRGGRLRPYLFAGPVWSSYRIDRNERTGAPPVFSGTRTEIGGVAGAGVEWWWNDNFGIRGEISDSVTPSPFEKDDFSGVNPSELEIPEVHNIHTLASVLWRF